MLFTKKKKNNIVTQTQPTNNPKPDPNDPNPIILIKDYKLMTNFICLKSFNLEIKLF